MYTWLMIVEAVATTDVHKVVTVAVATVGGGLCMWWCGIQRRRWAKNRIIGKQHLCLEHVQIAHVRVLHRHEPHQQLVVLVQPLVHRPC